METKELRCKNKKCGGLGKPRLLARVENGELVIECPRCKEKNNFKQEEIYDKN